MAQQRQIGNITFHLPAGYSVEEPATPGGRGGKLPTGPVPIASPAADATVSALLEQDFELIGSHAVVAERTALRRATGTRLSVDVAENESALMLVERDGLFTWHGPSEIGQAQPPDPTHRSPLRRSVATRQLTFTVPLATKGAPTAERNLLTKVGQAIARVTILKFVAGAIAGKVVEHLEAHVRTGLVQITDPDPTTWQPLAPPTVTSAAPRVLLFVHGTFSSTVGGFGSLGGQDAGQGLLRAALTSYDLVLGYDHRTLSVDPRQNAIDLLSRLRAIDWPATPTFDIVTHSRGALVVRSLVEEVLPTVTWKANLGNVVFVAGPHAGTQLANYDNWQELLDLYTSIAAAAAKLIPDHLTATILSGAIKGVGALAKAFLGCSLTGSDVPGIEAMSPSSEFIAELNRTQPGQPVVGTTPWFVIGSNFEPTLTGPGAPALPARVRDWIVDHLVDKLMKEANDLVVHTASMTAIDTPVGSVSGFVRDHFDYAPGDGVFHTNYFQQSRTATYLAGVLLGPMAAAAPPTAAPEPRTIDLSELDLRGIDIGAVQGALVVHDTGLRRHVYLGMGGFDVDHSHVIWPGTRQVRLPELPAKVTAPKAGRTGSAKAKPKLKPEPAAASATAYFRAAMPDAAPVGQVTQLTCTLGRTPLGPLAAGHTAQDGQAQVDSARKVTVQVIAKANVEVVGDDRVDVDLPGGADPLELYFDVRPLAAGEGEVRVVARQGPVPLVTLVLKPTFAGRSAKQSRGSVGASADAVPPAARPTCVKQWLRITERRIGDDTVYDFDLQADDLQLLCTATSEPLTGGREKYVETLYGRIEDRFVSSQADVTAFARELRALGGELWDELIPREFGRVLWKHREQLTNVLILSDEPFIPWELVHLKNGQRLPKESWFLARLGAMRWVQGTYPPNVLRHQRARYVVPDYPAESGLHLDATAGEGEFVRTQLGGTELTAESNAVLETLGEAGSVDLLHFAGHGEANETSARILLTGSIAQTQQGETVYLPDSLTDTTVGQTAQLEGKDGTRALVVLNACQAGRQVPKLTHAGGFAHAFIHAGAGAFVSSLWSVGDQPASVFVKKLYQRLLKGDTLAKASIAARDAARRSGGDATWMAYVVYGDPCARLE